MILVLISRLRHSHEVHVDFTVTCVRVIAFYVGFFSHDHPIVLYVKILTRKHYIQIAVVVRHISLLVIHISPYKYRAFCVSGIIND